MRLTATLRSLLFLILFTGFGYSVIAQGIGQSRIVDDKTKSAMLDRLALQYDKAYQEDRQRAIELAEKTGIPMSYTGKNGKMFVLVGVTAEGRKIYKTTYNLDAAKTSSTDDVWPGGGFGYSLTGQGYTMGEWDGGLVRNTHQEFGSRVQNMETGSFSSHATHVAGTMIAAGVDADAKGMAYQGSIKSYDFNNAMSEISSETSGGLRISNHSYGAPGGFEFDGSDWYWYGDPDVSATEDYTFGYYDFRPRQADQIVFNAPYHVWVMSAGNDGNDDFPGQHFVDNGSGGWTLSNTNRNNDGDFDCISPTQCAKNVITVGATEDIPLGYSQPSDVQITGFSSRGPTDDGRIKPDIVANGAVLYSAESSGDTDYGFKSGTSMSGPTAAGSIMLLQEHAVNETGGELLAHTIKGIVMHTADEAGNPGPDYTFGWGLLNTRKAADHIADQTGVDTFYEKTIANAATETINLSSNGSQPLRVTICWTDPAGTAESFPHSLNPTTKKLVNDLDLRISGPGGTFQPYVLNPNAPTSNATTGDNNTDNTEQVYIANPAAGSYTITVNHKGSLLGGSQAYAIIISGGTSTVPPQAAFTASTTSLCPGTTVNFTDQSQNNPTAWSWSFPGGTPSSSSAQNPNITYNTPGTYQVQLTVTNTFGTDTETKTGYIKVGTAQALPYNQDFDAGTLPAELTIENPDNGETWEYTTLTSANGIGLGSIRMEYYSYQTGADDFDHMILPLLDFSGQTNVELSFDHAYRRYNTSATDSLFIDVSTDCGQSWTTVQTYFEDGTGSFATAATSTTAFTPGNNNWCGNGLGLACQTIDLSAYDGQSTVSVRFRSGNSFGNNLYIDNINVEALTLPAPVADFSADETTVCPGTTVNFTDLSTNTPTGWSWTFSGGTPTVSTQQSPSVTYNAPGTYDVTLTATNSGGSDSETKIAHITVLGSQTLPYDEDFEGGGLPSDITIENPDNDTSWTFTTAVSAQGVGSACMVINNYNYIAAGNSVGALDYLTLPQLDLSNTTNNELTFDHAYKRYSAGFEDSLTIEISTDCGATWSEIVTYDEDGTGKFATGTGTDETGDFVPTATDWCGNGTGATCQTVDLSAYDGTAAVQIRFVSRSGYGNNLYLDNINVDGLSSPVPLTNFEADSRLVCVGTDVAFTDLSSNSPTAWAWSFTGPGTASFTGGTNANSQNPQVSFSAAGSYGVALTATNASGSDTETKFGYIIVLGAQTLPFEDDFETGTFTTKQWNVRNPDNGITWDVENGIGGGAQYGTNAAHINFSGYFNTGEQDYLITPPLNFSGLFDVELTFDHAYQVWPNYDSDTLEVVVSTDCGQTWTSLVTYADDGNGSFVTPPTVGQNLSFIPGVATDWCGNSNAGCNTVDLSAYDGMTDVRVAFRSTSSFSNDLYIDNVNIDGESFEAGFTADTTVVCAGQTIAFTDTTTGGPTGWSWSFPGGTPASSTAQNPSVVYNTPGVYAVTLVASKGALNDTESQTAYITVESSPSITVATTDASCGNANGSITVTASGGQSAYTYSSDGGTNFQTGNVFNNVAANTYNIVVSDMNSCDATSTATVNDAGTTSIVTNTATDPTCNSVSDGQIEFTSVSGGVAPYQYSINNGVGYQSASTFTGLAAGTYTLVARDALGCQSPAQSVILSNPTAISSSSISSTDADCGTANGELTITASGGTGTLEYAIDGGTFGGSSTFTGLAAGAYTLTVRDANNCTQDFTGTIDNPNAPTLSLTPTQPTCTADGEIAASATGGATPYTYTLNTNAGTPPFVGLADGSYTVTVTDASNCSATQTATLNPAPSLSFFTSENNPSGCGTGDGEIVVTITAGQPAFNYDLNGGFMNGSSSNSTFVISNLSAGSYNLDITDAGGCTTSESGILIDAPDVPFKPSVSAASVTTCAGQSLTLTSSNPTLGGTITWYDDPTFASAPLGTGTSFTTPTLTGTTTFYAREEATGNCNSPADDISLTVFSAITLATIVTDAACGASDGQIEMNPGGGNSPFEFSIDNGANFQAGTVFTGLTSGSYPVVVIDDNGCTLDTTVGVSNTGGPTITAVVPTDATCAGSDGQIDIAATGTSTPLEFSIDGGATYQAGSLFSNLTPGNYNIEVRDNANCISSGGQVTVGGATVSLSVSVVSSSDPSCNGGSSGAIALQAADGVGPYEYSVDGGTTYQSAATFTSLSAGTYAILARDANSCTATTAAVTLSDPPVPTITVTTNNANCGNNGSMSVAVTNLGTSPEYSFNNGLTYQSSNSFLGLGAGIYDVVARNSQGCLSPVETVTIIDAGGFTVSATPTDISCNGQADGAVAVTLGGGAALPVASYSWTPSVGNSNTITGLVAGTYDVQVVDANGCTGTATATVEEPDVLTPVVAIDLVACNGGNSGSLEGLPTGGTPPYEYSIDGGATFQSSATFSGLSAGTYDMTIRDDNGCEAVATANVITEPSAALAVSGTVTDESTPGAADGAIAVTVAGGTQPYDFSWSPTLPDPGNPTGLSAGTYFLTLSDDRGCTVLDTFTVNTTVGIREDLQGIAIKLYPVPFADQLTVDFGDLPATARELSISFYDAVGKEVYRTQRGTNALADGKLALDMSRLAAGLYTFTIRVDGAQLHTGKVQHLR